MIVNTLSFAEIRELQRLIIKQNRVISNDTASQSEKDEAIRIKLDAFLKLGVDPSTENND